MRFNEFCSEQYFPQAKTPRLPKRIPPKFSSGGFTFVHDPTTNKVSVTYGGKRIGDFQLKSQGIEDYFSLANRIINSFSHYQNQKVRAIDRHQQSYNYTPDSAYSDINSNNLALPADQQQKLFKQHDQDTAQHGDVTVVNPGKWPAIRKYQQRNKTDDELKEFAPTQIPDRDNGGDNEPRMTWDEILNYFTQTLTFTLGWKLNARGVRQAEFTKGSAVFTIDQGLSSTIFRYKLFNGQKVVMSGFAHTLFSSVTALLDRVRKQSLNEFAPSPDYGDDDWGSDVPRDLHHFANLWWNAADPDTQKYIEDQLATGGWKIQQIGEEMVELRHREGTRYRISSDEFDPDLR